MKIVVQRVSSAEVKIENKVHSKIDKGYLVLLGIQKNDSIEDQNWIIDKLLKIRLFEDQDQKMNLNIEQVKGELLIVSQFTLMASTKKGTRPGFSEAAPPEEALKKYQDFINTISLQYSKIQTGVFAASMQVSLVNEGPVTLVLDSRNK